MTVSISMSSPPVDADTTSMIVPGPIRSCSSGERIVAETGRVVADALIPPEPTMNRVGCSLGG